MIPTRVWARDDRALVISQGADNDNRYWDLRDGQWQCRCLAEPARLLDAVVLNDGRTFISGVWLVNGSSFLVEVIADNVRQYVAPQLDPLRLHAVGDKAPPASPYYEVEW